MSEENKGAFDPASLISAINEAWNLNDDSNVVMEDTAAANICCANCGKAEIGDVELNDCDKCDLAKYCGDKCQQEHRVTHEAICKERAAELFQRDEILFKQPESSHLGDCPICCLPIAIYEHDLLITTCCSQKICEGCTFANVNREREQRLKHKCPFCREPMGKKQSQAKLRKSYLKRSESTDPVTLQQIGELYLDEEDYDNAFKFFSRSAALGGAVAHAKLADMYKEGRGVEADEKKEVYHLEEAAIGGDPFARYRLGLREGIKNRKRDRAVKHWIIAANLGHDQSLQALKVCYKDGYVSKDDFTAALRAYQDAVDAIKSPQREFAEKMLPSRRSDTSTKSNSEVDSCRWVDDMVLSVGLGSHDKD